MNTLSLNDISSYKLKPVEDSFFVNLTAKLSVVIPFLLKIDKKHKNFYGLEEAKCIIITLNEKTYMVGEFFDDSSTYGSIRSKLFEIKNFDLALFLEKNKLLNTLINPVEIKIENPNEENTEGLNFFMIVGKKKMYQEPILSLYTKDFDGYYPEACIFFNQSLYGNIKKKSLSLK